MRSRVQRAIARADLRRVNRSSRSCPASPAATSRAAVEMNASRCSHLQLFQPRGQPPKRAVRRAKLFHAGRRDCEVGAGFAPALRRRFATFGCDEALRLQPFQCGVDAGERDFAPALLLDLTRDGNAVSLAPDAEDGQQHHELELTEIFTSPHILYI